jgi:ribosome-binding factor A
MANRRSARLNEQLKREISAILRSEVRDPRIGMPTVTEADVTQDLWLARIYVRPGPTEAGRDVDDMIEGLTAAAPFVRRELGRVLGIRRVPELRFLLDRTLEDALRVERILREVQEGREPSGSDPLGSEPSGSEPT